MKLINIVAPNQTPDAWNVLMDCIARDFCFEQTHDDLRSIGYYLPCDQFEALRKAFDTQLNMAIGSRKGEVK
ncbi:hypothetical protein VP424E501_P0268 [Vibrio phage 424E50-1]|nr:hypothetical protein VP424E501_P0268 [Vibrio phage 424E50-1]